MKTRTLTIFVQLLLAVTATACGGKRKEARSPEDVTATENAGRMDASSSAERAILKSLDDLPAGKPRKVGSETVTADRPYFAASGTRCREVSWKSERRLACRDPEGWYFVPNVFGPSAE